MRTKQKFFDISIVILSTLATLFTAWTAFQANKISSNVKSITQKQIAINTLNDFNNFLDKHPDTSDCLLFIKQFNQQEVNDILNYRKEKNFSIKFAGSNYKNSEEINEIKTFSKFCFEKSNIFNVDNNIKTYELVQKRNTNITIGIIIYRQGLEIIQTKISRFLNMLELVVNLSESGVVDVKILKIQIIKPLLESSLHNGIISKAVNGINEPREVSAYPCLEKVLNLKSKKNDCNL